MDAKKKIRPGSHEDIEGLARLPDESSSPVMRLAPDGSVLYANKFSRTIHTLVDPKTEKVDRTLVKIAKAQYEANQERRIDYPVNGVIFELAVMPVHEFEYVNIYGRDVTEMRDAVKNAADLVKFPNENPNPVMRALANGTVLFCNLASEEIPGLIDLGPPIRMNKLLSDTVGNAMRQNAPMSVHVDSGDRTFLFNVNPVQGEEYANIYGRDITAEIEAQKALVNANAQLERRVAERTASVRLLQNIVLAANSAESFEAALQTALHEICIYTRWPVGHAYVVKSTDGLGELVPSGIWHIETTSAFSDLRQATEKMRFGNADDIPGQVMAEGREVWVEDLSARRNFRRQAFIDKAELKAAMAFPVTVDMQVIGVLEFFAQDVTPANIEIIKTLEHVGAQLGSVAERKRAEEALAQSQKQAALAHSRLRDAIEAMGQAFVLFDSDDNMVLFNGKYREVIKNFTGGIEPEIGDPFSKQLTYNAPIRHADKTPEEQAEWIQDVLKFRASKKTRISTDQSPDGRWYRTEGFTTGEGGTVSIYTDITESKQNEEELARLAKKAELAHSRLTDALEVMHQAFVLFDSEDRIVLFNKKYSEMMQMLSGKPPEIGRSFEAGAWLVVEHNAKDASKKEKGAYVANLMKTRAEKSNRFSVDQMPDGSWLRAEGFDTADGGTVSIFTDVSEDKEHEAELQKLLDELEIARDEAVGANAAKSQFLANMSHELRTPLNAIIGYAELLIDDAEDDENEDYIPDLQKIQNAGKHLLGLINDILDLSKIEVGKIELFIEEFSVAEMLADVSNTIKPLVEKNRNALEVTIDTAVGSIQSDLTKLRQNLFNLLSNAAKFTEDGTLNVAVRLEDGPAGGLIVFDISDQGIGMTEEQLAKVFDPFTQADSSTSRKFGGTGLGLTITREFCRMLGGDVSVVSEVDVGTTFTMKVAVDANQIRLLDQKDDLPEAKIEVGEDAPLILIIDDDKNVRELLHRNISASGYRTELAKNGKEGLEKAKKLKPDAITLDVIMPHVDGWSVLGQLKASKATADIPVVMVTIAEDRSLGFSLGAAEYLSKPVDRKKLISVLKKFLKERSDSTVLLVEDDEATRSVMRSYLEKEGNKVIEVENGRKGIEAMTKELPSLVLLDLMMPEMDGFGFVEEYRKHEDWHSVPVVVVTAKTLTKEEKRKLDGWVEAMYSKLDSSVEDVLKDIKNLLPE